jgi:hypothetical protein
LPCQTVFGSKKENDFSADETSQSGIRLLPLSRNLKPFFGHTIKRPFNEKPSGRNQSPRRVRLLIGLRSAVLLFESEPILVDTRGHVELGKTLLSRFGSAVPSDAGGQGVRNRPEGCP